MRSGGSNDKGGKYERLCAKALSRWLSDGQRDDLLWRTAMSGGRATLMLKSGTGDTRQAQTGDLGMIDPLAAPFLTRYTVETKHYKSLELDGLIKSKKSGIVAFWRQARDEAYSIGTQPFMVARQNRFPDLLGLHLSCARKFFAKEEKLYMRGYFPRWDLTLFYFDDFLQHATKWWEH